MKTLNNRGWGLSIFLILVCVILIALLVVVALAIKLVGGRFDINWNNESEGVNYIRLEETIEEAAKDYQQKFYSDISEGDRFIVTISRLKEERMLTDSNDCTGYVEIYKDNTIDFNAYLHCANYTTNGYEERLDG